MGSIYRSHTGTIVKTKNSFRRLALCAVTAGIIALSLSGCTTTLAPKKEADAGALETEFEAAEKRLQIAEPAARTNDNPLVLVHYMPWYQAPPIADGYGYHWHQGGSVFDPYETLPDGRSHIASQQYPLTGPYDSRDQALLEYQALLMKMAGIDGVIFDWYGIDDALDYRLLHESTLAAIEVFRKAGLSYAICYEDQSIGKMIEANILEKSSALEKGKETFRWMEQNWFSDDAYVRIDGRPLVLCFGPQYFKDKAQWDAIFAECAVRPWFSTLDGQGKASSDGSYNWTPMWASSGGKLAASRVVTYLNDFYASQNANAHLVATAFPAFHDIYKQAGSGAGYGYLDYAGGRMFKLTLDAALRAKSDVIQIQTWNDYGEGTIIEPTIERGYRELEALQDAAKARGKAAGWQYADLRAPIEILRKVAAVQSSDSGDARAAGRQELADATRKALGEAVAAGLAGDSAAFRTALAEADVKYDLAVKPILRGAPTGDARDAAKTDFDPAGRKNLALGAPVVVSGKIYDFIGSKAVDGDAKTYWEGAASVWPGTLTVDLVTSRELGTALLKLNPARVWSKRTQTIEVLSSDNGTDFSTVLPAAGYVFDPGANGNAAAIPLNVKARYIRFVFTSNTGANAAQAAEIEIYGKE